MTFGPSQIPLKPQAKRSVAQHSSVVQASWLDRVNSKRELKALEDGGITRQIQEPGLISHFVSVPFLMIGVGNESGQEPAS